ncbi:MAG: dihydropteroate synthase [Roseobacter sp.]|jgi:dihydropteroate synthase
MTQYIRPVLQVGPARPADAETLAGGWTWFTHVEVLERGRTPEIVPVSQVPDKPLQTLLASRAQMCGLSMDRPRVMGILNTTPDSFSDGGENYGVQAALAGAEKMQWADILDVGGESTRPGAKAVPSEEEIDRTVPVISALRASGRQQVISIDTRKAVVAEAALAAGAGLVNDVSGLTFDAALAPLCARQAVPVCVMHAQGDPATMQDGPQYADVLLDVYDFLAGQMERVEKAGVPRQRIIADPGIGFGKTLVHNLALLRRLSLFHSLGVPILLGASRKRFIGTIGDAEEPAARMPGSVAVALAALHQGVQIVRVHDVSETVQAIALWRAVVAGSEHG